jgi:hypothetical protein
MTTESYLYPSIRVYEVDNETNTVVNWVTYRLDLASSTKDNPVFIKGYDFLELYNYTGPVNFTILEDFANKVMTNLDIAKLFVFHYQGGSPWGQLVADSVDLKSARRFGCGLATGSYDQYDQCSGVVSLLTALFEKLQGEWYLLPRVAQYRGMDLQTPS